MSEPTNNSEFVPPKPFKYKGGITVNAKGVAQPFLEVHSDDVVEFKTNTEELWMYLLKLSEKRAEIGISSEGEQA